MKRKPTKKIGSEYGSMYRIVRSFLMLSICVLCAVALLCGVLSAGANTKLLTTGDGGTTLALAHREQRLELNINEEQAAAIELPLPENIKTYLSFAPPPFCNLFWLADSLERLFS